MSKNNVYGLTLDELCRHFGNELLLNLPKSKVPIRLTPSKEVQLQEVAIDTMFYPQEIIFCLPVEYGVWIFV